MCNIYEDKFSETLIWERISLKKAVATLSLAEKMFLLVDQNREYFGKWFDWVDSIQSVEDELRHLFHLEEKMKQWVLLNYWIFLEQEYIWWIWFVKISHKHKKAEIWYWLSEKYSRKWYMKEAMRLFEKEVFTHWNFDRIQIKCDVENVASEKVATWSWYIFEWILRQHMYNKYFWKNRDLKIFSKLQSEFKL